MNISVYVCSLFFCYRNRIHSLSILLLHEFFLFFQFIITQVVAFVIGVAGSAVLLDYSTLNSSIQPYIRDSMRRLIMSSSDPGTSSVLKMIQENVSIFSKENISNFDCVNSVY